MISNDSSDEKVENHKENEMELEKEVELLKEENKELIRYKLFLEKQLYAVRKEKLAMEDIIKDYE